MVSRRPRVLCLFGTRPEVIKLAPVLRALATRGDRVETVRVASSQHRDLVPPFARHFGIGLDFDLEVMEPDQTPAQVSARVIAALEPLLARERPDLVLVQGDTTTAMSGALAAFFAGIPVAHVEAGLRSGDPASPFPEEMNRRLITRLSRLHFAATPHNVETLLAEGVPSAHIELTGNPVVDALEQTLASWPPGPALEGLFRRVGERRLVVLTTHRRESFGALMRDNLRVLRGFVERHEDIALAFPVHPNPHVTGPTREILADTPRVHLLEPLGYPDFLNLLRRAWLLVSDSGGIQEEAPTLGKPLLVLRANTERPEAVEAGVARLVGGAPDRLAAALEEVAEDDSWARRVEQVENPFGRGDAGERIATAIDAFLSAPPNARAPAAEPARARAPRALSDFVSAALAEVQEISPEEARRRLEVPGHEGWHFVDVREPDEFAAGCIPGARNIPRGFLEVRADLVHKKRDPWLADRSRRLVLYCGGGHRSALAAQALQQMGFEAVVSLAEGWTGWTERRFPVQAGEAGAQRAGGERSA